jgi:hypothetical protein
VATERIGGADIEMRVSWFGILLCTIALEGASAAPLELAPGSWEFTYLSRDFSISADGTDEIEGGNSGPDTARTCVTEHAWESRFLYPGLKNPTVAKRCEVTVISETSDFIDTVMECSAHDGMSPSVEHAVVVAPTQKSLTIIRETTFLKPNYGGSVSRSTSYERGRWLKDSCDQAAPKSN